MSWVNFEKRKRRDGATHGSHPEELNLSEIEIIG